jgi:Phage major capsid protein E
MNYSTSDVHIDQPLTQILVAYTQDKSDFISNQVFPEIRVQKQSDRYYTYDRGDWLRAEMQERAPGTESGGASFGIDNTPTYYCREYGVHQDIPDQVINNADAVLSPLRDATEFLGQKILRNREKRWQSTFFKSGVWATEKTGVASNPGSDEFIKWNSTGNPIKDIRNASTEILERTGYSANRLVLGKKVFDALMYNPYIVDLIKYGASPGSPALASADVLAQVFEVEKVLVEKAVENTAQNGKSPTTAFIGGNNALLCYSSIQPGILQPSSGYCFTWQGPIIRNFRMEHLKSTRIEAEDAFDFHMVSSDLGVFFSVPI